MGLPCSIHVGKAGPEKPEGKQSKGRNNPHPMQERPVIIRIFAP